MPSSKLWQLVLLLAIIVAGCAAREAPEETNDMEIAVDFREVHRCSRISPEITVSYAPHGTKFYDVRLLESGSPDRYLGGGLWQADGTGIIPEGALTTHYVGPCPKANRETEYVYVVTALEDPKAQPLVTRLYRFKTE